MSDIFCLTGPDGRLLDPAVQATVLAKYSRSPISAKEILANITIDEADRFHDKWIMEYGHNSVLELSTIPICIEGLSIIASKVIESMQRGAFSEKSTRYQRFSSESFVTPPGGPPTMKAFVSRLYSTYDRLYQPVIERCAFLMGKDPKSPDRVAKARAFDNLRYLLPAGTGTNIACVLNFRDIKHLVSILLGHTNSELRQIGAGILSVASELCPVLMRYSKPDTFEPKIVSTGYSNYLFDPVNPDLCVSLNQPSMTQSQFMLNVEKMYGVDWDAFSKHMEVRPEWSEIPDAFKMINMTFDIIMDYGAFRDLQRHRRCEQYVESLTADYGYVVPDDIKGTEFEVDYRSAMDSVQSYDDDIMYDRDLSQYVIPMGYLHRSKFQMTMKELFYIIELRSKPQGHISYRRIVYMMYKSASTHFPELMQWCRVHSPTELGEHT